MFFSEEQIKEIQQILENASEVVLVSHRNPDGDALGSTLGLKWIFDSIFMFKTTVIVPDAKPDFLQFLPGFDGVLVFENEKERSTVLIERCDVLFCLDFNHPSRTGEMEKPIEARAAKGHSVMIDHHQQPAPFAQFIGSDTGASSTSEMVYHFSQMLGVESRLGKEAATCLYTGIMTDTGSFRFSATSPETHRVAAHLLASEIQHWTIHEHIFNQNKLSKLQLWGEIFRNRLFQIEVLGVSYMVADADLLAQHQYEEGDLEGLVNFALSLKGTTLAALFSEKKGKVRISFRSVGNFSVNAFAREHFEGGGHENAAGGSFPGTLDAAVQHFLSLIPNYKSQLKP